MPISPTSARSLSSSRSQRSSPGAPRSARRGPWRVDVAKLAFPRPPSPPRATITRCPGSVRSPSRSLVAASRTTVPGGTKTSSSSPRAPVWFFPLPWAPRPALKWALFWKWTSVFSCRFTSKMTSPPWPPLPPAGPPRGTYFSRRKATAPFPPSPAFTWILASSKNIDPILPYFSVNP